MIIIESTYVQILLNNMNLWQYTKRVIEGAPLLKNHSYYYVCVFIAFLNSLIILSSSHRDCSVIFKERSSFYDSVLSFRPTVHPWENNANSSKTNIDTTMSYVICHVTCDMWHVMWHVTCVTCHVSYVFFVVLVFHKVSCLSLPMISSLIMFLLSCSAPYECFLFLLLSKKYFVLGLKWPSSVPDLDVNSKLRCTHNFLDI